MLSGIKKCCMKTIGRYSFWTGLFAFIAAWCLQAAEEGPLHHAKHAPQQPRTGQPVTISISAQANVKEVQLWTQMLEPGAYVELKDPGYKANWQSQSMTADKAADAGSRRFIAELPGSLQSHRRLIRYRFTAKLTDGKEIKFPFGLDDAPNLAYFVYDGLPPWPAAIAPGSGNAELEKVVTYDSNALSRVQTYWLIAKGSSVQNTTWRGQNWDHEYHFTGTLVVDGKVYDHVRYRARGGAWRYAMGKNMWKFDFYANQRLKALDDYGRQYPVSWSKLNLFACIDQGDFGGRGEQGMFDAVGFRLFNMAGVPASMTHWLQLRIVSGAEETPANQYRGDYWGLYLAMENLDGRFLKAHDLPEGNLFKMEGGTGKLSHNGPGAPVDLTDLNDFLGSYEGGNKGDAWWQSNLDLPGYYSYRAICEAIHHYDIGGAKNYYYFHNPTTKRWQVFPWDIDLTWADNMFGDGNEPFRQRVLIRPQFRAQYQNRLREIRDLLYNPAEMDRLIDEYAAIIADPKGGMSPVQADRAKWDYHPALGRSMKGGHGLFYQSAPSQDFAGMVKLMKNYVRRRAAWIDGRLLKNQAIPATPKLEYAGLDGYPAGPLAFKVSPYQGAGKYQAMQCRLAEVALPETKNGRPVSPGKYEIDATWDSGEITQPQTEFTVPAKVAPGHSYRVRARHKDDAGAWSHWSEAIEFRAGPAAK